MMGSFLGLRFMDNGPRCERCGNAWVRFHGEWCRACDTHGNRVRTNLRKMIPWVIGSGLLVMGARMAFSTYLVMR